MYFSFTFSVNFKVWQISIPYIGNSKSFTLNTTNDKKFNLILLGPFELLDMFDFFRLNSEKEIVSTERKKKGPPLEFASAASVTMAQRRSINDEALLPLQSCWRKLAIVNELNDCKQLLHDIKNHI